MSAVSADLGDGDLVRRSLAGEVDAFARLVEKHQRLVYGVALSNSRDVALAEDLAQEAFVQAWRDLSRLHDPARVGSWIAGIARNLAHRVRRHTARRQRREEVAMQVGAKVATPLDGALQRETQTLVRDALAGLPAAYREALVLYYVQGESIAKVAEGLGISEELVKQRMSRGRRSLRAALEKRVEGALEQLGPSKGFTVAVTVAVSSVIARKASAASTASVAGKLVLGMKASTVVVIGAALIVVGVATWYGFSSPASEAVRADLVARGAGTAAAPHDARDPSQPKARKLASRAAREELLHAIRSARERATAAARPAGRRPTTSRNTFDNTPGDLDKDYIHDSVSALLPAITACYETALETKPELAGSLVVNFTIEGEPDVGGLVTESTIDPTRSEINDVGLSQCVQEAMFGLEIEPPSNGGVVKVTYPFTFAPGA